MSAVLRWSGLFAICLLLPIVIAAVLFSAAFLTVMYFSGAFTPDAADWNGGNEFAVGMMGLMAGGASGLGGFIAGAVCSVWIWSRASLRSVSPLVAGDR